MKAPGNTTIVIRDSKAQIEVTRPVLIEKAMSLVITVSDLLNPVRLDWRIQHKMKAIRTSPAAASALTVSDNALSLLRSVRWMKLTP